MYRTGTRIAAALATLALAAPIAAAHPIAEGSSAASPVTPAASVATNSGFDWLDAAIGAAVATGVFSLSGAGVLVARRPREDANAALGAH